MNTYPKSREEWAAEAARVDGLLMAEKMKPPDQQRRFYLDRLWAARHVARQAADYDPPTPETAMGARTGSNGDGYRQTTPQTAMMPAEAG